MSFEHLSDASDIADAQHEDRIRRCKRPGCNAQIIWFKSRDGSKNVPVDADTVEATDTEYDWVRHGNHHETCKGRRP